jgi:hypothetical protein
MRPSIAEWDTHSLSGSACDISSHGAWGLQDTVSKDVRHDGENHSGFLNLNSQIGVVVD